MEALLITGTQVVSLDPFVGTLPSADVLVLDGRIAAIGPDLRAADPRAAAPAHIDGTGTVAVPGFVDTHRHTWQKVIRGMLAAGTLGDYFGGVLLGLGPAFGAEDIYAGNLIGSYEALNSGVTTIVDWCNNTTTPAHPDAAVVGLQEAGIRAMFAYGTPGGPEWMITSALGHPVDAKRAQDAHFSPDRRRGAADARRHTVLAQSRGAAPGVAG